MNEVSGTDFGAAASEYQRGRPGYPARSASWLLGSAEVVAGSAGDGADSAVDAAVVVADVGAGTGKLTQSLVGAHRRVIAVDPDERMLAALSVQLRGVETRPGTGESLPLEDSSVDLITYGQSWHWVDPERACAEAARVLCPGGVLGLIWNIRDESVDWVAELTEIITPSTAEVYVASLLKDSLLKDSLLKDSLLKEQGPGCRGSADGDMGTEVSFLTADFAAPAYHCEAWARTLSVDELVDMVASRSHTIVAAPNERQSMLSRVRALGERVRDADGSVRLPYVTHAFRAVVAG
ncbi:class I SAM-dependent methyltransferase [Brevibacterium sp.]|uniref:class I SAM-dependent methyltransferase n=1 Tax=Brevibacterium sp. TaxID=1701 RepID=UPI002811F460|nr:class I SAM-dependent methyltransferase [Brevibacterium sp.]